MDFQNIEYDLREYLFDHDFFISSNGYQSIYYESVFGYSIFEAIYNYMENIYANSLELTKIPYRPEGPEHQFFYVIRVSFCYKNKINELQHGIIELVCNGQPYWNINPITPVSA